MKIKGIPDVGIWRLASTPGLTSEVERWRSKLNDALYSLGFDIEDVGANAQAWVWFDDEADAEIYVISSRTGYFEPSDFGQNVSVELCRGGDVVQNNIPSNVEDMFSLIDTYIKKAKSWSFYTE